MITTTIIESGTGPQNPPKVTVLLDGKPVRVTAEAEAMILNRNVAFSFDGDGETVLIATPECEVNA